MTKLVFNPATAQLEMQDFSETIGFDGRVDTYADLPAAASNPGAVYLVEQDTGSIFLLNKREAGTYRSNGVNWVAFTDVSAYSIETDNTNIGAPSANAQSALDHLSGQIGGLTLWIDYVTNWDTPPSVNKSISGGTVYDFTFDSVTRYRFVPSPYASNLDTFYADFDPISDTLSNPIVSRGT